MNNRTSEQLTAEAYQRGIDATFGFLGQNFAASTPLTPHTITRRRSTTTFTVVPVITNN